MKIKSLITRNLTVNANHTGKGGEPFSILIVAGSELELPDTDFSKVEKQVKGLVKQGVLAIVEKPETKLTVKQIVEKVKVEAEVDLDPKLGKEKLVDKAEGLGVEL